MINYIVSNSYGVGDALMTLNTIFLFEKNKNREITISFHQRDNEKTKFNFLNISNIFSYFFLKPISLNCHIKYESSSLESDEIGEENFKIKDYKNFYFDTIEKHNLELDIERCKNRKGVSSLFYELGDNYYAKKSISKEEYKKLKKNFEIEELYQFKDEIRTRNIFHKQCGEEIIGKNLKIINRSNMFIGSEGLWTHYSRALGVKTYCINSQGRYLANMKRNFQSISDLFKKQGHFLFKDFDTLYGNINGKN